MGLVQNPSFEPVFILSTNLLLFLELLWGKDIIEIPGVSLNGQEK